MTKDYGSLYIVSTPIGNLDDITLRAIEVLNKVDLCAAEDTRVSKVLFNKYNIHTKITSYHKFSEKSKTNSLINELKLGKDIALISDAGTPLISDPGHHFVKSAIEANISIIPIPGVTSVVTAATISGFNLENFTFYGFFPNKEKDKKILLNKIKSSSSTSIIFESGRRINKLLNIFENTLSSDTRLMIAREMTKLHETVYRGDIKTVSRLINESEFGSKGEFVIVIEGIAEIFDKEISNEDKRILDILMNKLDQKLAFEIGSEILKKKRNTIYQIKIKGEPS
jgi:16S rRNA (cytidine1402-2'-O)-methyltransferase